MVDGAWPTESSMPPGSGGSPSPIPHRPSPINHQPSTIHLSGLLSICPDHGHFSLVERLGEPHGVDVGILEPLVPLLEGGELRGAALADRVQRGAVVDARAAAVD